MNNDKKTPLQVAVRILIIIGIIILLLLLSFGIIKLVPKALNSLTSLRTSLFSLTQGNEKIVVSTEPTAFSSGKTATINWKQTNGKTVGYYTFEYICTDSVTIQKVNDISNESYSDLACNQPFNIGEATSTNVLNTLTIRALNSSSHDATTTLVISHREEGSLTLYSQASTTITVFAEQTENTNSSEATSTPAHVTVDTNQQPQPTTNTPVKTYAGPADLAVSITQLGIIDPQTNRFVPSSSSNASDRIAMQFQVTNIGGSASGAWKFRAYLPTSVVADQIYDSALQSSIPAGRTSYFTIGFYGSKSGTNQLSIVADSSNQVQESNESNNQASSFITINRGTSGSSASTGSKADLSFQSIETGVVDKNTGSFVPRSYFASGERPAVRFQVTNKGGQSTGSWSFKASVNNSSNDLLSGNLTSLQAGETRTFITGFDVGSNTNNSKTITITLDNNNQVSELNENNNSSSVSISSR